MHADNVVFGSCCQATGVFSPFGLRGSYLFSHFLAFFSQILDTRARKCDNNREFRAEDADGHWRTVTEGEAKRMAAAGRTEWDAGTDEDNPMPGVTYLEDEPEPEEEEG